MDRVEVLQMGPYPEWDQGPLDAAFKMHRYFEASDPSELVRSHGENIKAIATRGEIGATAELIEQSNHLNNLFRMNNSDFLFTEYDFLVLLTKFYLDLKAVFERIFLLV